MNEKQVIKKLILLKNIQPTQPVLENMKKNIYLQVQIKSKVDVNTLGKFSISINSLLKLYKPISYGITFTLLVLFLSMFSVFPPNKLHDIILYTRLTLAPNQYEKASIALADTTDRFGSGTAVETDNTKDASRSIALANSELSNLKLKGENGKYTAKQCHQIYQEYLRYLEKENQNISTEKKQSLTMFKLQLSTYEELAEKKLHMYNKL